MFLSLLTQQWQAILRQVLTMAGTALVAKGLVSPAGWEQLSPLILTAVGALVALGSAAWSVHSNQAKVIKTTADKLTAQGK